MMGVCMTVLSIGRLGPGGSWHLAADKLMAVDAFVFLLSAALSFLSMRSTGAGERFEARAEAVFLAGLVLLGVAAGLVTFAIV